MLSEYGLCILIISAYNNGSVLEVIVYFYF